MKKSEGNSTVPWGCCAVKLKENDSGCCACFQFTRYFFYCPHCLSLKLSFPQLPFSLSLSLSLLFLSLSIANYFYFLSLPALSEEEKKKKNFMYDFSFFFFFPSFVGSLSPSLSLSLFISLQLPYHFPCLSPNFLRQCERLPERVDLILFTAPQTFIHSLDYSENFTFSLSIFFSKI